ncbi:probable sodium-coupled neutral amino acid transporter 6 [Bicyclus anynana]|uniref:Probable sodium-coupled neutral amino acid transporter 6 n=1 Tax=Bicyclus anynana TaxID=110368 RepID=A0A6J1P0U0_BICAN|nr:probable sodium-coupled neutral amino acid transporter 6 [Bicyclus anynana]XP_052742642.1 probable sodium-coupled neutral amino acid transporter 6 [Bicyclus anynana]
MKIPRTDTVQGSAALRKPTTVMIYHDRYTAGETTGGLSVLFTMLCIVDLFGVFPVVALPKTIISCGIYGVPLVISVFALQLYTAVLLGRSWLLAHEISPHIREKSRFPYAAVAELAFGTQARRLVTFLIDATVFGAGVPNFIFASQSMQMFWWKITGGEVGVTYCVWMMVIGLLLCPVMWLGSPKDMKPIALTSVCIVTTVAIATWTCICLDNTSAPASGDVLKYVPNPRDFLVAYGIIAFQFDIHPMLLTLQVDMKDSRKINSAVLGAFGITGFMFMVTSLLAADRYGNNIENNILQGMPPSIALYIVALLVTLQLCLSSAVGNSALFQHIEDLLKIPREFCFQRCLLRSGIVALAVFLGESVPRFDLVMGLVGSTLTGPLMFIFPPLFFLKLCYKRSNMKELDILIERRKKHLTENNINRRGNNGGLSKFPLILPRTQTKYKTFVTQQEYINNIVNNVDVADYTVKWYDVLLAVIVMVMGIVATFVATYISWSDAISSAEFSPPCLLNATAAARSFIETANHKV